MGLRNANENFILLVTVLSLEETWEHLLTIYCVRSGPFDCSLVQNGEKIESSRFGEGSMCKLLLDDEIDAI